MTTVGHHVMCLPCLRAPTQLCVQLTNAKDTGHFRISQVSKQLQAGTPRDWPLLGQRAIASPGSRLRGNGSAYTVWSSAGPTVVDTATFEQGGGGGGRGGSGGWVNRLVRRARVIRMRLAPTF